MSTHPSPGTPGSSPGKGTAPGGGGEAPHTAVTHPSLTTPPQQGPAASVPLGQPHQGGVDTTQVL